MIDTVIIVLALLIFWVVDKIVTNKRHDRDTNRWDAERCQWQQERQQLLDRIQAPSFDHLKHHEVKVIKAQNGEKEPPKLEPL